MKTRQKQGTIILKNALVLDEYFQFNPFDVGINGDKIILGDINYDGQTFDLQGMFLIPGLIDTHVHGAYGVEGEAATEQELTTMARFEATQGVTSFAPTIRAMSLLDMEKAIRFIASVHELGGAKIGGIHIEGPFVTSQFKGALLEEYLQQPSIDILESLCTAGKGIVKLITIAPELEGADKLIQYAVSQGIKVSMGHTNSTFEETEQAITWGATQATHLFNAMRPFHHREPGVLGSVMTNEKVTCELICDFVHVHPAAIKMVYLIKGEDKINIISDSCMAAGRSDGEYHVSGQTRYVKNGVVRNKSGTIAGSSKTILDGVRNLVSIGIPLETVVKTASINPAKTLGIDHETGSIQAGKMADLVVLDQNFQVKYTFVNGICMYQAD